MPTKNITTRYSQKFRKSIISLSQTGQYINSLSKKYNASVSTINK